MLLQKQGIEKKGIRIDATTHGFAPQSTSPLPSSSNSRIIDTEARVQQNTWTQPFASQEADQQNQVESFQTPNRLDTSLSSANHHDLGMVVVAHFQDQSKRRVLFNKFQISELEKRFRKQHYLTAQERQELAHSIGLTSTQVQSLVGTFNFLIWCFLCTTQFSECTYIFAFR